MSTSGFDLAMGGRVAVDGRHPMRQRECHGKLGRPAAEFDRLDDVFEMNPLPGVAHRGIDVERRLSAGAGASFDWLQGGVLASYLGAQLSVVVDEGDVGDEAGSIGDLDDPPEQKRGGCFAADTERFHVGEGLFDDHADLLRRDFVLDRDRVDDRESACQSEVPFGRHQCRQVGGSVERHGGCVTTDTGEERRELIGSVRHDWYPEGFEGFEGESDIED